MKKRCFLVFSVVHGVSVFIDLLKCWLLILQPVFHCDIHAVTPGTPREHTGVAAPEHFTACLLNVFCF